jgi:hypothetical protein
MNLCGGILLFFVFFGYVSSGVVHWIQDDIRLSSRKFMRSMGLSLNVTIAANGKLLPLDVNSGHFRAQYSFLDKNKLLLSGVTDCISFTESAKVAREKLMLSVLSASSSPGNQSFNTYFNVYAQKFYSDYNSTVLSTTSFIFSFVPTNRNTSALEVNVITSNCSSASTWGYWTDPHRWKEDRVPTSVDQVFFPTRSGAVQLQEDVSVSSLNISSGTILAVNSGCPSGWTADDRGLNV